MRIRKARNPVRSWRQQMMKRFTHVTARVPMPLVAISYLDDASIIEGLVEIQQLTLVVMFEVSAGQLTPAVHVAGFTGQSTSDGVRWGGPTATRFRKDFTLKPEPKGPGRRLDARPNPLLDLALHMNRKLQLHQNRYAHYPRAAELPLPPLWAAFRNSTVKRLSLASLETPPRDYFDLQLFPLGQVRQFASQATTIFADVQLFQTVRFARLQDLQSGLCGQQGPVSYDFTSYPLRRRRRKQRCTIQR